MILPMDYYSYLTTIETSLNKRFHFREEIIILLRISDERMLTQVFDDLLFFAKFLNNATVILQREGSGSDNTSRLMVEFKENLEKSHTLIRTLIKESPEQIKQQFISQFLGMSQECMSNLFSLFRELTWIKNYRLDYETPAGEKQ